MYLYISGIWTGVLVLIFILNLIIYSWMNKQSKSAENQFKPFIFIPQGWNEYIKKLKKLANTQINTVVAKPKQLPINFTGACQSYLGHSYKWGDVDLAIEEADTSLDKIIAFISVIYPKWDKSDNGQVLSKINNMVIIDPFTDYYMTLFFADMALIGIDEYLFSAPFGTSYIFWEDLCIITSNFINKDSPIMQNKIIKINDKNNKLELVLIDILFYAYSKPYTFNSKYSTVVYNWFKFHTSDLTSYDLVEQMQECCDRFLTYKAMTMDEALAKVQRLMK